MVNEADGMSAKQRKLPLTPKPASLKGASQLKSEWQLEAEVVEAKVQSERRLIIKGGAAAHPLAIPEQHRAIDIKMASAEASE